MIKSDSLDTVCGAVFDCMVLYVFTPATFETTGAWDFETIRETIACQNSSVHSNDDLPDNNRCGLRIVDDRVSICCHDADTHTPQTVTDTDARELVAGRPMSSSRDAAEGGRSNRRQW